MGFVGETGSDSILEEVRDSRSFTPRELLQFWAAQLVFQLAIFYKVLTQLIFCPRTINVNVQIAVSVLLDGGRHDKIFFKRWADWPKTKPLFTIRSSREGEYERQVKKMKINICTASGCEEEVFCVFPTNTCRVLSRLLY